MSYILDALRKAEAERERGNVPSIHAHPVPSVIPVDSDESSSSRWWAWVCGLVVIAVIAAAAFAWWKLGAAARPAAPTPALGDSAATAPSSVGSSVQRGTGSTGNATTTPTPPLPATAPAPIPEPPRKAKPIAVPAGVLAGAQGTPGASGSSGTPGSSGRPAATQAQPVPSTDTANGPIPGKIYALSELPDAIRSQLPNLTIGGSMYSPVPANRVLIVNGQVAPEGSQVAPDLVLEQIRVKSAVLKFRGYRYSLPF